MSVVADIKDKIANLYLKYKLMNSFKSKDVNKFSFDKVKTVAILFDATDKEDYELMKKYVTYLREYRKKVKVIGYYAKKEVPDFALSKLEYDFFSQKELNFIGVPLPQFVEGFINEEFDLLLDLNIKHHFPLKYISSLSKANFKVGEYNEKDVNNYDLMINIEDKRTLKYLMKQIDIYLGMFNK